MGDFPLSDVLFIIQVVKDKSYVANLGAFIKSVTVVANYAATHVHFNPPKPGPVPPVPPNPNPPVSAMSDDEVCAMLQDCADHPEGGIPMSLIMWLTQLLLGLL